MKKSKLPLTKACCQRVLNSYERGLLSKSEIRNTYGWTVGQLRAFKPVPESVEVSEEHYLAKCPKCHSRNIAMCKHYSNVGVIRVSALCRECHTRAMGKDYLSAMVEWNSGHVVVTH